jgi:hypothetical protein
MFLAWRQSFRELLVRLSATALLTGELALGTGLLSGTALALFVGRFMLAAWLALGLLGVVLRFTRRRARERRAAGGPPARWRWWFAFLMALLLPWVAVIGSSAALEAWWPGLVLTTHWKLFSSLAFLAGTGAAVGLVLATSEPLALRLTASGLLLLGGLVLALMMQMESRCEEDAHVGRQPADPVVASCR